MQVAVRLSSDVESNMKDVNLYFYWLSTKKYTGPRTVFKEFGIYMPRGIDSASRQMPYLG